MQKITFILLLCFSGLLSAQTDTLWTRCIGGSGAEVNGVFEKCQVLVKPMPGNDIIMVSNTASTDGIASNNHGSIDILLVKLNSEGDTLWSRIIGGSDIDIPTGLDVNPSGQILICGYSYSTDGDLVGHHGTTDETDGFIALYDADGNKTWAYQYGGWDASGIPGRDYLYDVKFIAGGDIIACGSTSSVNGDLNFVLDVYDCGWVLQVNEYGTVEKSSKVWGDDHNEENANELYRIIPEVNGNNYVAVGLQWYFFTANMWLTEFDSYGNKSWEQIYGPASGDCYPSDLIKTSTGEYLVASYINGSGGDVSSTYMGGSCDAWVFTADTLGQITRQKSWGGLYSDVPNRFLDAGGAYFLCGQTSSSNGYVWGDSTGYTDFWIVKFDAQLDTFLTRKYGGEGVDALISATINDNSEIIVAGRTESTTGIVNGNNGSRDIWLAKLSLSISSVEESPHSIGFIYPNPAQDIVYTDKMLLPFSHYKITDACGRIIAYGEISNNSISVSKLPKGLYWLTVYENNLWHTFQMLK